MSVTSFYVADSGYNYFSPSPDSNIENNQGWCVINGTTLRIMQNMTPTSSTMACYQGQMCYDDNYFYVATADNTWKRAALSTW